MVFVEGATYCGYCCQRGLFVDVSPTEICKHSYLNLYLQQFYVMYAIGTLLGM